MNTIIDFVATHPGEPYRFLPLRNIFKNGEAIDAAKLAEHFRLPHFKPPIKIGTHDDTAPAAGHIVALEVRGDWLYAVPEWTDKGVELLRDGAYRYHSPEIIWEGGLENPFDGSIIPAPLVVGDALLHTPHLGDEVALYIAEGVEKMTNETISVPASLWDKFTAWFDARLKGAEEPRHETPAVDVAQYEAAQRERDEYRAKLAQIEAEAQRRERVEKYSAQLRETKADASLAELLADVPEETAAKIMEQFRALSAQINESALLDEKGKEGAEQTDPKAVFNALVLERAATAKIPYNTAFDIVKNENPELFVQAFKK